VISGNGELIEPDDGILAIGSGGSYALAAARALLANTTLSAPEIARKAMMIAGEICVYHQPEYHRYRDGITTNEAVSCTLYVLRRPLADSLWRRAYSLQLLFVPKLHSKRLLARSRVSLGTSRSASFTAPNVILVTS